MPEEKTLTGTLRILEKETSGSNVLFGDIVQVLNHRGFAPLLMAPALLTILPTGAIPGFPAISALFICLIAGQIVFGRRYPWLPGRLKAVSFDRGKMLTALEWAEPYTKTVDRYVRPRFRALSHGIMQPVIAFVCCLLAVVMAVFGFIPFVPALICIPVLFFATGIGAKDGLMVFVGFVFTVACLAFLLWLSGVVGGDEIKIGEPVFVRRPDYFLYPTK